MLCNIFLSLTTSLDLWSLYFSVFLAQKTADVSHMKYDCLLSFTLWVFFLLSHEYSFVWWLKFFNSYFRPVPFPPSHPTTSTTIFRCQDFFILPGKQFHFNILTPSKAEDDGFETIFMCVMRKSTFTYLGLGWVMGRADIRAPGGLIWPIQIDHLLF